MSMNKMREIKQSTGKMKRGKRKTLGIYKAQAVADHDRG
jgi:hypothetical protein